MTTPIQVKAREFKLQFDSSADNPRVSVASEEAFIEFNECIHVIEKSAYDKIVGKLKEIAKETCGPDWVSAPTKSAQVASTALCEVGEEV